MNEFLFSYIIAKTTNLYFYDVTVFLQRKQQIFIAMTSRNDVTYEVIIWKYAFLHHISASFPNYVATVYAKTYYCITAVGSKSK